MKKKRDGRGLRAVLLLIVLLFTLSSLPAAINRERIYPVDSEEYRYISWLSLIDGIAMPSSSGPWSGAELQTMLNRIDREDLDDTAKVLYDRVSASLDRDAEGNGNVVSFDFGFNSYMDGATHTDAATFTSPDVYGNWGRLGDFNRPNPLLEFEIGFAAGDNIYAYTEIPFGMNRSMLNYTDYLEPGEYGKEVGYKPQSFRTNLYLIPPSDYMDIDLTFPWRNYFSIGGDWWNFTMGKDRLSVGPGMSGNLLVGDQIPFHNNARVSFFSDRFKYTLSISSFIHPDNYIRKVDGKEYVDLGFNENNVRITGASFFMFHRFESRWDKVSFALNEAVMYQSDSGADLALISPLSVFHNLYMRSNANSLLSIEFEYDFGNIDWYTVLLIDDFNFPGEHATKDEPPPALGLQIGMKGAWSVGNGILHSSLESVVTSPFLYLRDDGSRKGDNWGINFIVDFPEFNFNPSEGIEPYIHNLMFLGYRYGNDVITLDYRIGWESLDGLKLDFGLFYMAHGVRDKYTRWSQLPGNEMPKPGSTDQLSGSYLKDAPLKNVVSHTIDISFSTDYPLKDMGFSFLTKIDFLTVVNYGNRTDGGTKFDFQFMFGVHYSY